MKKEEVLNLFKNHNFKFLWANQILTQIAYNFLNFALMVLVYRLTQSNFAVALLVLTIIIPTAIFSIFAGIISDFFDKRKIMMITNFLYAFLVLFFIFLQQNVLGILTLSFLINLIDRFFTPAQQASLPLLVPAEKLLLANSLFSITINTALILGMTLAGPSMIIFGDSSPFLITSFLVFLAAISVYFLPKISVSQTFKVSLKTIFDDTLEAIKEGYSFLLGKRAVLTGIIFLTGIQTFVNIGISLAPGYAEKVLFIDVRQASLFLALPVGIGALLGIYFLNSFGNKILKRVIIRRGVIISGLSALLLGVLPLISRFLEGEVFYLKENIVFSPLFLFAFLAMIFLGASFSLMTIPTVTLLAEKTPKKLMGRVFGVFAMFQNAFAALPLIFIGAIADQISVYPLLFLFAILTLIVYNLTKKKSLEGFFYG